MKKILLLIALIFVTGCPSTQQQSRPELHPLGPISLTGEIDSMLAYKVYVKGLVCPACAVGLKKFLLRLPFVKTIHVNYKTGLVLIYEKHPRDKGGAALDKSRITKAVEDSGYEVDRFVK
jgi:copper chaperone CopZ